MTEDSSAVSAALVELLQACVRMRPSTRRIALETFRKAQTAGEAELVELYRSMVRVLEFAERVELVDDTTEIADEAERFLREWNRRPGDES